MIEAIRDWIRSLFGKGKIRAEIETEDGGTGTVVVNYIGALDTMNPDEFRRYIIDRVYVETGRVVTSVRILGYY